MMPAPDGRVVCGACAQLAVIGARVLGSGRAGDGSTRPRAACRRNRPCSCRTKRTAPSPCSTGAPAPFRAAIAVGKRPRGIKLSRDGTRLFVALSGSPMRRPGVDESKLPPAGPRRRRHRRRRPRHAAHWCAPIPAGRIPSRSTSRSTAGRSTSRTRRRRRCRCWTWRTRHHHRARARGRRARRRDGVARRPRRLRHVRGASTRWRWWTRPSLASIARIPTAARAALHRCHAGWPHALHHRVRPQHPSSVARCHAHVKPKGAIQLANRPT